MKKSERIAALEQSMEIMARELEMLRAIHEIRTLHFKYGYFMDKCLFGEIIDLFSEDCAIYFLGGLFRGKAGARRLYGGASGLNGPADGMMFEHFLGQDIVDVAPDRRTARGRFRCFMFGGVHETKTDAPPSIPDQFMEGGVYENTFVKEDGVWKIKVFNYNVVWQAGFDEGWAHSKPGTLMVTPYSETFPGNPRGPDEIITRTPKTWPQNFIVPFHYPHPVTGKDIKTG
jgi:hypothetical protein